jgi:hypothetical protein
MDVHVDMKYPSKELRMRIYRGELAILRATAATAALVRHAGQMIEEAFAPYDPRFAHQHLSVAQCVEILTRLKPAFIHHPETQVLLRHVLIEYGSDPEKTYQDVPRLRVAYPSDFLTTGIAYAHHAHRDTWYSAPAGQINWWLPIYEFLPQQGMAFHPQYWDKIVKNDSENFNYYQWNSVGRKNAAKEIGKDTRVQPRAQEPLILEPQICFVLPPGATIVFSGAQLHSTIANATTVARWSIDFRTVDIDDVVGGVGAQIDDSQCTGTSLRDFRRTADFAPMPEEIAARYDDAAGAPGVRVFRPDADAPSDGVPSNVA